MMKIKNTKATLKKRVKGGWLIAMDGMDDVFLPSSLYKKVGLPKRSRKQKIGMEIKIHNIDIIGPYDF